MSSSAELFDKILDGRRTVDHRRSAVLLYSPRRARAGQIVSDDKRPSALRRSDVDRIDGCASLEIRRFGQSNRAANGKSAKCSAEDGGGDPGGTELTEHVDVDWVSLSSFSSLSLDTLDFVFPPLSLS